jgi:hypothetical protein
MDEFEIKGKRTEGWLLKTASPRITKKSPFLKKLEAMQNPPKAKGNVTQLKRGKREA